MNTGYLNEKLMDFYHSTVKYKSTIVLYPFCLVLFYLRHRKQSLKILLFLIRSNYSTRASKHLLKNYATYRKHMRSLTSNPVTMREAWGRTIVLSMPTLEKKVVKKKGVILFSFTSTFSYFLTEHYVEFLNKYFLVVLEPSSAGYADVDILECLEKFEDCIVQTPEIKDRVFLNSILPQTKATTIGASDWVNPELFYPIECEKIYDAIYIANTNPVKRVYHIISTLRKVIREVPDFKAIIVIASWGGGSIEQYKNLIKNQGLENNIVIVGGQSIDNLRTLINKSKCSLVATLKEGANRVLFESMFCDVPVISIFQNTGINKNYINENTGLLVADEFIDNALTHMYFHWKSYNPREWALRNISPKATTIRLENFIKSHYQEDVNVDLYIKCNQPEASYFDFLNVDSDRDLKTLSHLSGNKKIQSAIESLLLKSK